MLKFDDEDACGKHEVAAQSTERGRGREREKERQRDWWVFDGRRKKQMEGGVEIGGGSLKKLAATLTNGLLLFV